MFVFMLQCKLIVCQMSNTRCQALSWLLLPMLVVVLLAVTGVAGNETLLLYLWTAAVILAHIHYGVSVVSTHRPFPLSVAADACLKLQHDMKKNGVSLPPSPGTTAQRPLQHLRLLSEEGQQ